jgi:hypothetical protein
MTPVWLVHLPQTCQSCVRSGDHLWNHPLVLLAALLNTYTSSRRHDNAEEQKRLAQEKEDNIVKLQRSLDLLNQQLVDPGARRLASPQATGHTLAPSTAERPTKWSVFSDEGAAASTSTQPQHRPPHPAAPRVSLELSRRPPATLPEGGVRSYDEHRPAPHPALKQSWLDSGGPRVEARPGLPCVTPTSARSFLYGSRQAEGGARGRSPRDPQATSGQRQHGVQERWARRDDFIHIHQH